MVDAPYTSHVAPASDVRPVKRVRIGPRAFWLLFAVEGAVIGVILLAVIALVIPAHTPLAAAPDRALVREAVLQRINGTVPDPLIDVGSGVSARTSNLRGFTLDGVTYYYYLEGKPGFDPLSRGAVSRDQVEIVLRDSSGPTPLVIYILR
jgi:hypothetical protein